MSADIHAQKILILDFGSQYTELLARRVREIGVYCEIYPCDIAEQTIKDFAPAGIILSGGPDTVVHQSTPRAPNIVFTLGCPVLGVCYGMQTMAQQLGGQVIQGKKREFGYARVVVTEAADLLAGIQDSVDEQGQPNLDVWMSHGDQVQQLPPQFKVMASTENCALAGMFDAERRFYGVQFHPEVSHTRQGKQLLSRFVLNICGCLSVWTPKNIIQETITNIQEQVGHDKVILGLSGGVDSSVAAALLHRAIGKQLICVFVDTGLLRLNESEQIQHLFAQHFGMQLIVVNAAEQFYTALCGVEDPEMKRKIIGREFIKVFEAQAHAEQDVKWLAQGTIYPDVIESAAAGTGKAHVIKSHHNVGGLPKEMRLQLVEPLRELFKDEVRQIGTELGLPYELVYRHPFPGPGLGVRILGEVRKEYVAKLQQADAILIAELYKAGLYDKVSQAFAVFLPVKSVGVLGDARHYDHVLALRIVETVDFMTAHWARLPYEFLDQVANRIINEVPGISRVTYDISGKPPATIEWE